MTTLDDNAFMESCFRTLMPGLEMTEYKHQRAARCKISADVTYDNIDRTYSVIGYYSPHRFEQLRAEK